MLTLFVLVCHVANPTACFTAEDVISKHEDKASCRVRAYEMARDITMLSKGTHFASKWDCFSPEQLKEIEAGTYSKKVTT